MVDNKVMASEFLTGKACKSGFGSMKSQTETKYEKKTLIGKEIKDQQRELDALLEITPAYGSSGLSKSACLF